MRYHRVAVLLVGVALAGGVTVAPLAAAEKRRRRTSGETSRRSTVIPGGCTGA